MATGGDERLVTYRCTAALMHEENLTNHIWNHVIGRSHSNTLKQPSNEQADESFVVRAPYRAQGKHQESNKIDCSTTEDISQGVPTTNWRHVASER